MDVQKSKEHIRSTPGFLFQSVMADVLFWLSQRLYVNTALCLCIPRYMEWYICENNMNWKLL